MIRRNIGSREGCTTASLQIANRNASGGMKVAARVRPAQGGGTAHHLEQACARLQDAAEELESVLFAMPSPAGQADLHEALGSIMETLQLIASAHARLEPPGSGKAAAE